LILIGRNKKKIIKEEIIMLENFGNKKLIKPIGQETRTKCNTVAHCKFLEKIITQVRNEKQCSLYRLVIE